MSLTRRRIQQVADEIGGAFRTAARGGRHAGMLENYAEASVDALQRAAASFEERIAEHERWRIRPTEKIPGFFSLDPRHQRHLLGEKWPADIKRLREQRDIIEGLIRANQYNG